MTSICDSSAIVTAEKDPDGPTEQLQRAGFRVERDDLAVLQPFPKKLYFKVVEGCYMSALTSLSEEARSTARLGKKVVVLLDWMVLHKGGVECL